MLCLRTQPRITNCHISVCVNSGIATVSGITGISAIFWCIVGFNIAQFTPRVGVCCETPMFHYVLVTPSCLPISYTYRIYAEVVLPRLTSLMKIRSWLPWTSVLLSPVLVQCRWCRVQTFNSCCWSTACSCVFSARIPTSVAQRCVICWQTLMLTKTENLRILFLTVNPTSYNLVRYMTWKHIKSHSLCTCWG